MRLQILPLPTEKVGDAEHTPFIIVVDQWSQTDDNRESFASGLRAHTGATAVLISDDTIDVPSIDLDPADLARIHATLNLDPTTRAGDPLPTP